MLSKLEATMVEEEQAVTTTLTAADLLQEEVTLEEHTEEDALDLSTDLDSEATMDQADKDSAVEEAMAMEAINPLATEEQLWHLDNSLEHLKVEGSCHLQEDLEVALVEDLLDMADNVEELQVAEAMEPTVVEELLVESLTTTSIEAKTTGDTIESNQHRSSYYNEDDDGYYGGANPHRVQEANRPSNGESHLDMTGSYSWHDGDAYYGCAWDYDPTTDTYYGFSDANFNDPDQVDTFPDDEEYEDNQFDDLDEEGPDEAYYHDPNYNDSFEDGYLNDFDSEL